MATKKAPANKLMAEIAGAEARGYPFYVYALADPRDGMPFYIGKGRGRRVYEHEKEALRKDGYVTNSEKRARIDAILAEGLRVEHRVLAKCATGDEALEIERATIARWAGLTNRNGGHRASSFAPTPEKTLAETVQMLAQEIAKSLAWEPQSHEASIARMEHIDALSRAMALACKLAAEVVAAPSH
jgi:hypothetical protein